MQLSLRSQLVAGTAAVVGASAIAMTPVTTAHLATPNLTVPSVEQVALAAFDNPVSEAINSLLFANGWVWGSAPFVNFGPWADFSAKGVIPQVIRDGLPIIRELGLNGSAYIGNSVNGLGKAAFALSEGVWDAIGDLLSLDISGAINAIVSAVQTAGNLALASANYVLTGVVLRATKVATNLSSLVPDLIQGAINQPLVLAGAVLKVAQDTITKFVALDFEGAWNAFVDGTFGSPNGIPGVATLLTIGPGVPGSPVATFVPSIRTEITTVVQAIKDGLATPNPAPPPVQPPVAAVTPSVLRQAAVPAPATAVSVGEEGEGAASGDAADDKAADNQAADNKAAGAETPKASAKAGKHGLGGSKRAAARAAASAD